MADYLAFGAAGCQFNSLTFSDFSYSNSRGVRVGIFGPTIFPSPSEILVGAGSDPASLGSGGAALGFSPPAFWNNVNIGFDVAGPGIVRDDLSARLQSIANLESADISESAVPGGNLRIVQGFLLCSSNPLAPPPSPFCDNPTSLSFAATGFQEIAIGGDNVNSFETGFATPEPTTLLLWGTTAAGLGLAARRRRRRQR